MYMDCSSYYQCCSKFQAIIDDQSIELDSAQILGHDDVYHYGDLRRIKCGALCKLHTNELLCLCILSVQ